MKGISILALTGALVFSGVAFAQVQSQEPLDNVGKRHPNLQEAQHLATQADQKLVASQQANEFDEGGHAQKAKNLLDQAIKQMSMAAAFDNAHEK